MYTYTCTHRAYTLSLTLNIYLNFTVLLQSSTWLASFFCTTVQPGWNPLFSQWDEKLSFHMSLCRTRSHPSLREGGWKVEHGSRAVMKLWPTLTSRRVWGLYPRLPMDRGEPKAPSDSGKLTIESHAYIFFLRFRKELPLERYHYVFELVCPTKSACLEMKFHVCLVFYPSLRQDLKHYDWCWLLNCFQTLTTATGFGLITVYKSTNIGDIDCSHFGGGMGILSVDRGQMSNGTALLFLLRLVNSEM